MTARSIILRTESIRSLALSAIVNLPIGDDQIWELLIRPYKKKRGNPANNLYWKRLGEVADQAWICGKQYSAETMHEHCKHTYLPEECAKGIPKWTFLPGGNRVLLMSTTDLNVNEFSDYLECVTAFGAGLGVMYSADPS